MKNISSIGLSQYSTITLQKTENLYKTSKQGLHEIEAKKRLKTLGKNILVEENKHSIILDFLIQFKNPMVLILAFAAIISFIFGEGIEGIIILLIIPFQLKAQRQQVIEPTNLECWYSLVVIRDTIDRSLKIDDTMILKIGKTHSLFYSYYTFYNDSLRTDPVGKQIAIRMTREAIRKKDHSLMPMPRSTDDYIYKYGNRKRILREAMQGTVPQQILNRTDKMGFVTPEELWLKGEGRHWFKNKIDAAMHLLPDGIDGQLLMQEVTDIMDGRKPFSFLPWRVSLLTTLS